MAWTLPTEAGFYYMKDLAQTNPFEVGMDGSINWDKDLVGKKALLKIKEQGSKREMLGFECLEDDYLIKSVIWVVPVKPCIWTVMRRKWSES